VSCQQCTLEPLRAMPQGGRIRVSCQCTDTPGQTYWQTCAADPLAQRAFYRAVPSRALRWQPFLNSEFNRLRGHIGISFRLLS